jgi:hypothetical protein
VSLVDRTSFHAAPNVRASISDDGLVILDVHNAVLLASNETGARIWRLLEERRTPYDIARQFADDYALPPEQARSDVDAFIAALVARRLIVEERTS